MRIPAVLALLVAVGTVTAASAEEHQRVEVVQLRGVVDSPMERAIVRTIDVAEREGAVAVVVQIDSPGAIGGDRVERVVERILSARVPVITWIGPPGAEARHAAAVVAAAGHVVAMAPGAVLGPSQVLDLRADGPEPQPTGAALLRVREARGREIGGLTAGVLSADEAERSGAVDLLALQLREVLDRSSGRTVRLAGGEQTLVVDSDAVSVRFRKADLIGRVQHGVAQPSIAYLLILLGLVGLVFELFHPSTGPAGFAGLVGLALGLYGVAVLGGSWVAVALIVVGVAGFCVDLRVEGLGLFTLAGLAMLVAGSLTLFGGPFIRPNPWVLGFGVVSMVVFLLGAMTRVLRDLRAVARGELEVTDPHPH